MRVWLELNQEEGERLFEAVKGFTVNRMQTAVVSDKNDKPHEELPKQEPEITEDKPEVTLEMVRAVLTEKKRSGKNLKSLFSKFGANKLSEVAPKDYTLLLQEAETL